MRILHCQCDICEKTIDGTHRNAELSLMNVDYSVFILEICPTCRERIIDTNREAISRSDFERRKTSV